MAKSSIKIEARKLRKQGRSIKEIERLLFVSRSTASRWCNDILLTPEQIDKLARNETAGCKKGQLIAAEVLKKRRLDKIAQYKKEGELKFQSLPTTEFYVTGLALYLAEGAKKSGLVMFTNSDVRVIKFMLDWFEKFFGVTKERIACSVLINISHLDRDNLLKKYWSENLGIPPAQFRKTKFVHSKNKKRYENHDQFFGTFTFSVLKSTDLCYKILGQIEGLLTAKLPA